MLKMLLYFILLVLLTNVVWADKQEGNQGKLTILSISQSPSSTVRPVSSSIRGGTLIYIKVSGNSRDSDNVQVYVGNFPCLVPAGGISDSYITCETTDPGSSSDLTGLYVTLISKGKTSTSKSSDYVNYVNSVTPQLNEIFPTAGFAKSNVYFSGSFPISSIGDGKQTGDVQKLMIGNDQCNMIDVAQSNPSSMIKCIQSSKLEAGNYNITQQFSRGYAIKSPQMRRPSLIKDQYFQFTHLPTVSSISQSEGEQGGQKLTISGTGFSKKKQNNSVSIDGTNCFIQEVQDNKIKCKISPRNNSASARLFSSSANSTGYFSGVGLNYAQYANGYSYGLDTFISNIRNKIGMGSVLEKGFRAELREFTYGQSLIGETWNGYFTAPVSGLYTFRGLAAYSFKMYLSTTEGSTELPPEPFIYSTTPFQRWNNFYYDDIYTAQRSVNLTAGRSYYLEAYHLNYFTNYFKISVDVPNNDTTLPNQAFEVHRLAITAELQQQEIVYSFIGGSNGSVNLKLIRTDKSGKIYYNVNTTVQYGCSSSDFHYAITRFDSYSSYRVSVIRNIYDSAGNLTNQVTNAFQIDYVVSLYLLRDISYQKQDFIVTKYNFTGNFTKTIQTQHSPLISGTFSLQIGGVPLNRGQISYAVSPRELQSYFRTIIGYENVEVESKTEYGCGYSCVWIISYKGVNAPIPNITLSSANLQGGSSPPVANMTVRRYYSPHITFEPIDYRFLNTHSNSPNVLVSTNGLLAVCTGNCSYQFKKVAVIQSLSLSQNILSLSIKNTSRVFVSEVRITVNGLLCAISSNSTLSNIKCSIAKNSDGSIPLTAGPADIQVFVESVGVIQPESGVPAVIVPLVVTGVLFSSGGMNGGIINQIFGGGFTQNNSLISISVCNQPATIRSSSHSQITFYMPSCGQAGMHAISVSIGGQNFSSSYSYNAPTGPLIQSITPKTSNPTLKTTMTIVGSGFGVNQSAVEVFLSNSTGKIYQLKIMNFTNTSIVAGLSGGQPGNYIVQVTLANGGGDSQPVVSGADLFSYSFTISSISPNRGSYYGGTLITITGTNFSPAYGETLVYVGSNLNWFCNIENITKTQIKCRTPGISKYYKVNQNVNVVISTKLYMLNTCPANNCHFAYLTESLSPQILSISTTTATTQNISLVGQNFYSNLNSTSNTSNSSNSSLNATFKVILYSKSNSSLVFVLEPLVANNTFAIFYVAPTVPQGDYNVRIRNSIGQSNPLFLSIKWNIGNMNMTVGSTQGNIVAFTGGSGFPYSLSNSIYVTIQNPTTNEQYEVNVISCCSNNIAVISVPAAANGSQLYINFVTPSNTYSTTFSVFSSYTPRVLLLSNTVVNPGTNSITLQRNDTFSNPLLSIVLVSTINKTDLITVSNWTTALVNSSTVYSFSINLVSGSYKILALTTAGYCTVNGTISVQLLSGSTITSKPASYSGDQVTINGQYLSPSSYISINGFIGNIISYTPTSVKYKVPAIDTATFQTKAPKLLPTKVSRIASSKLTIFSDQNSTSSNAFAILDGVRKTAYYSSNQVCWIGLDVGAGLAVLIDRIRYFPSMDWDKAVDYLLYANFEGSNDMTKWTILGQADSGVHSGWNTLEVQYNQSFRYIRLRHNSNSQCKIAEMQLYGKLHTSSSVSLASQYVKVTYKDGYNSYSFNNALELRQDHTPIVQSVTPQFGDIFGGYQLTINGLYLNFGAQKILIDSVPCAVVASNSTQINCIVGARPNYPSQPSFIVTVNGSTADIKKGFLYVLKWSDSRTWGVDLPPVDGDLIYIPAGMTLLIDQDTPNLLGIAAQDATLIFPNSQDITVTTGFITMVRGSFIAGTESNPALGNLNIILTGDYYGKQQPAFGNKGIGCLDCKFSMYGKPRKPTWTTIANTINPGDLSFTVSEDVDWKAGEVIVVASTSFQHHESESKTIIAISNRSITVDSAFTYQHVSVVEQYGSSDQLTMRAEVGLLSRNIEIKGDNSTAIGQYGPHVMFKSTTFDNLEVQFAYVELSQCGQPQIPGRHCIFFNMAKELPKSYVRGNSIYSSFAKMIVLYGTSQLTVEDNVGYQNKGHNIYLQSGTQKKNVIRKNLVISALSASNMMQTDQSVAAFWITHPKNDIYGNHVAGSDYYGIFYSTSEYAKQPSDVCTFGNKLGVSSNNVIHSCMEFGLRIFKLYARTYPCRVPKNEYDANDLWSQNPSFPSVLSNFTIYKNKGEGVWAQQIGNLMLNNFTVADNIKAGIQFQVANFTKEMVSVNNSIIIGRSQANLNGTSYLNMAGVITPRTGQSNLTHVRFYNFPINTRSIETCSKCASNTYLTSVGNEIYFKKIQFTSIQGQYLRMLGAKRDIIYDLDGSLSLYFFNTTHSSTTLVNHFNHIANYNNDKCRQSPSRWTSLVLCNPTIIIRRIMLTNAIGAKNYYDFNYAGINILPIANSTTVINSSSINYSLVTSVSTSNYGVQKPYSWSLPFVAGTTYQVWWSGNLDFNHLSITTTPIYGVTEPGVVFKFPYTVNRELYSVGPMRGFRYPNSSQIIAESLNNPEPDTCINGEYRHVNDVGSRMLAICQSGKNKTKYQYTEINAVFCKYVCPIPPLPALPSSAGIIVKESFVRFWSNASQWPNGTIPAAGQDVYISGNWTVLLDMDPHPANFMLIDGTLIADDTRDVFFTAQSIHIRAGNISIGYPDSPFEHKFTIQVNNTHGANISNIDEIISGKKLLVVTGSLNLYGTPPATTSTQLTQTAFSGDSKIFVASSSGWSVGDSLSLSPSFGQFNESQRVIITSLNNSDGSISLASPLKFTHYGSTSTLTSSHGTLNLNTQVGHLERNIKILSGPDTSLGLDFIVYGYYDNQMRWVGSLALSGVQVEGVSRLSYLNVIGGTRNSTITKSSFSNCLSSFLDIRNSYKISFTNNVFFGSRGLGVFVRNVGTFTFTSNLMMGVRDSNSGCFLTEADLSPSTNLISIKYNYCLGSAGYGFFFPLIPCTDLETNPLANNTVGSAKIGFIFGNIETSNKCKAFSYIKAYGCKIAQIANPTDTTKLVYEHFVLADNQRGATLKFADESSSKRHIAQLSKSYITAHSRPSCAYCYGLNKLSCSNNIGVQLLSVSTTESTSLLEYFDQITTPEVFDSKTFITSVEFNNFKTSYNLAQCQDNYIFRPHRQAYDAVATHSLFKCTCTSCDDQSFLLADANDASQIGWSGGCGEIVCTGKSNYLIIDWNGTVFGSIGTLIPNNSQIGLNQANCTFVAHMNAFFCRRTDFAVLSYQSAASDYNSRIMWPVTLFYDGANYSTTVNGWRQWNWKNNVPQNRRLGRFVSIVKLNATYNITFKSMPPAIMHFQIEKRSPSGNPSNFIIVKVKYPVPNLIRVTANSQIKDPILLTDGGLKRNINTSMCGDNIYYYTNYTTNFVVTEGTCLIKMELVETVQLTTHFAMNPNQFFSNTIMSSFIDNLCALLGVTDTSRVKVVGVYSGSTIVEAMILPPNITIDDNSTTNGASSNDTVALPGAQPSLTQVQQILGSVILNGTYSGSMLTATGYQVITSTSAHYEVPNLESSSNSDSSSSTILVVSIVVGAVVVIILTIVLIIHFMRRSPVSQDIDESVKQEKEIASDSIVFSNEALELPKEEETAVREQKNRLNRVTNNMRRNKRLARNQNNNNSGMQVREINKDYFDFEE